MQLKNIVNVNKNKKIEHMGHKIVKSLELTKGFVNAKCRLRLDNETRCGSTFLRLEQIVRAD